MNFLSTTSRNFPKALASEELAQIIVLKTLSDQFSTVELQIFGRMRAQSSLKSSIYPHPPILLALAATPYDQTGTTPAFQQLTAQAINPFGPVICGQNGVVLMSTP